MTDDVISEEMVEAGAKAINGSQCAGETLCDARHSPICRCRRLARTVLAAALPLIVAAERERLITALEPFANAAANWDGEPFPDALEMEGRDTGGPYWSDNDPLYEPTVDMITVGDLRRARAAIRSGNGGGGG